MDKSVDIVDRLRAKGAEPDAPAVLLEAAAEIEQLRLNLKNVTAVAGKATAAGETFQEIRNKVREPDRWREPADLDHD